MKLWFKKGKKDVFELPLKKKILIKKSGKLIKLKFRILEI
jgi:hypothetical protein